VCEVSTVIDKKIHNKKAAEIFEMNERKDKISKAMEKE